MEVGEVGSGLGVLGEGAEAACGVARCCGGSGGGGDAAG